MLGGTAVRHHRRGGSRLREETVSEPKLADEAGGGASRKASARLLAGTDASEVQLVACGEGAPAEQSPRKVPGASQLLSVPTAAFSRRAEPTPAHSPRRAGGSAR